MNYTCAIVEKEPLAEATLRRYIARTGFLDLVWTASSVEEASTQEVVDLLLIATDTPSAAQDDDFMRLISSHKQVIVIFTYPQEAEDTLPNLVTFLTKPISFDAFAEAMAKFLEKKAE